MKTSLFTLLLAFLLWHKLAAQCPTDITFSTQVQINAFPGDFPGCTAIPGNVTVSGNGITNLNGLSGLTNIGGDLFISSNNSLINLDGLNNIDSVGNTLTVFNNDLLFNLNGLNGLKFVGGDAMIQSNPELFNLNGLNNLDYIGGTFRISSNNGLTTLNGLIGLDSIGGGFVLQSNGALAGLNGVNSLSVIGGSLSVFELPLLTDLSGLENLKAIGGLGITKNASLTTLSGLDNLDYFEGDLFISDNNALTSLTGIGNISATAFQASINNNPSLVSLSGLDNFSYVGLYLDIHSNASLADLTGLGNLNVVNGSLSIAGNNSLGSLSGLNSLEYAGSLSIQSNDALASLAGLDSLLIINNGLYIGGGGPALPGGNISLSSLSGLDNVVSIGGDLYIQNNTALSACAVESICAYLNSPAGAIVIDSNATGCNSHSEVAIACQSFTNTISGKIFWDEGNCQYDGDERPLRHWLVKAESDSLSFYAVTDSAGHYSMVVDTGIYVLSVIAPNRLWDPCFDTIELVFNQLFQTIDTNIAVLDTVSCPLLSVDIGTALLRRCYNNFYRVNYCNEGTATAENVYAELYFDAFLNVDTASLPDLWTDLGGNRYRVELGNIESGDCSAFSVKVNVDCDSTETGEVKCVEARIFPDTICYPVPGWDGSNIIVRAACQGDSVQFRIINTGADMSGPEEYIIIEDVVLREDVFQLPAGEDTVIAMPADNGFVRLEAEQDSEHPFSRIASATSEGCPEFIQPTGFLQFPQDEASPFVAVDCHQIVSSFDPNDKSASPQGLGDEHTIRDNTPLEYLIRFQNTGTDTALTVVVRDTLSPFLDPATVRPGTASHPYRFDMSGNGILKFTFDNIMLPDSNVNEAASHGFVQFSVAQKSSPTNPPGTVIKNEAAIYFDYNAPVQTNTVFHTVAKPGTTIFRDTVCNPPAGDVLLSDTTQFSYFEVIRETLFSDTVFATLDTTVALGDTIFGVVVLSPATIVKTLKSVNGCDSILQVSITIPATEPAGALPFQLFPNPTGGNLNLRFTPGMQEKVAVIEIHDARGRLKRVFLPPADWNGRDAMTLPVSELPGGVYFITVYGQKGTWTGRFAKFD